MTPTPVVAPEPLPRPQPTRKVEIWAKRLDGKLNKGNIVTILKERAIKFGSLKMVQG
jgi:hypothetical protein